MRGACPPLTWWPAAEAATDPGGGGGGSSPRQRALTQGRRDAAKNVREPSRWRWGGLLFWGGWGGGWVPQCGQRPRGSGGGEGGRGHRPGAVVPPCRRWGEKGSVSPPPERGDPSSPKPSRSARRRLGAWRFVGLGRLARMPRRGGYPASWAVPCTGVPPGGVSSEGPGKPGGPTPARRTMRPPLRAGPQGRALGVLARPGARLSGSVGSPRDRHVLRGLPGSSG